MSRTYQTQYQELTSLSEELYNDDDHEVPPCEEFIIQEASGHQNRSRWTHLPDLDDFFIGCYQYVQLKGYWCICLGAINQIIKFLFMVFIVVLLVAFVDYEVLFRNHNTNSTVEVTISDIFRSVEEGFGRFTILMYLVIAVSALYTLWLIFNAICICHRYREIRAFFNDILKISDGDLNNILWHDVQKRLIEVQREHHMCIHKSELTQLDITHRILRNKNYMVAMFNKSLLPIKFNVPFLGEYVFFTAGMKYNYELIFFGWPYCPFENKWQLRSEYKNLSMRKEMANELRKKIVLLAVINFVCSVIILIKTLLYVVMEHLPNYRNDPKKLSSRVWTENARLSLRHFNELPHEFDARLSRAYRPAEKYTNLFSSPLLAKIADPVMFITGTIVCTLTVLAYADIDTLTVQGIVQFLVGFGVVFAVASSFIPEEYLVFIPETLMTTILCHIHYMPDNWKGQAHTERVRSEFTHLFKYKVVVLLEQLISPIITPLILLFSVYPKAQDFVDFMRNYTVNVEGVGDVCSFAQMDIRRHGDPEWQSRIKVESETPRNEVRRAEHGKTELSLMNFTLTNPEWRIPDAQLDFINTVRLNVNTVRRDYPGMMSLVPNDNPLVTSSQSLSMIGQQYASLTMSAMQRSHYASITNESGSSGHVPVAGESLLLAQEPGPLSIIGQGVERNIEYSLDARSQPHDYGGGIHQGLYSSHPTARHHRRAFDEGKHEQLTNEMSFSALLLFEQHVQRLSSQNPDYDDEDRQRRLWQTLECSSVLSGPTSRMPNIQEEDDTVARHPGASHVTEMECLLHPSANASYLT